ncbi:MAG: transporter, partial [Saprospiraceae bacterium]|nr:transporter [Saprospiraceae bacterium]
SLQFRMANMRNNRIINMEATVTMSWLEHDGRDARRKFIPLPLERERVVLLPLNWTIVHPIDEDSPLWRKTPQEVAAMEVEIIILIAGYDETFAQQVHANTSYTFQELDWHVKFTPMFYNDGSRVVLELDKISDTQKA